MLKVVWSLLLLLINSLTFIFYSALNYFENITTYVHNTSNSGQGGSEVKRIFRQETRLRLSYPTYSDRSWSIVFVEVTTV